VEDRPPEDDELVARARAGDGVAFGQLVARYQEIAFRTAYLVLGDAAEAEDATQEAFVNAYRALGRFRPGSPLRPWLLRIVANRAQNRRRAAGRRVALALRAEAESGPAPVADSAEAEVMAVERRRELLAAVNALEHDDRVALAARYFLDLAEAEVAALLGVARGTVKSRLSRARARLASRLADADAGDFERG
jgi:RNA polymerase sigma factor (sigma-70 family)